MVKFTGLLLGVVFSWGAIAQVELEACKKAFTNLPYCVSRANAEAACKLVDGSDKTFKTIADCLTDFSEIYGAMTPQLHTLCLGGYTVTGNAVQDASDCAK